MALNAASPATWVSKTEKEKGNSAKAIRILPGLTSVWLLANEKAAPQIGMLRVGTPICKATGASEWRTVVGC